MWIEPGDSEDNLHHAGGTGCWAGEPERWAAGEGATMGSLEGNPGGWEEPGWEEDQGGTEAAGCWETEQVTTLYRQRLSTLCEGY